MAHTNREKGAVAGGCANLWRILAAGAAALILAACGGGGGGDGGSAGGSPPVVSGNPPSVSADPQALGSVGDTITLAATASDPDGDAITYSWRQDQGLAVSDESGFDTDSATFTAPGKVDTLVFTVTATAGGQADSAVVRVIVVEDTATAVFVDGAFAGTSDGSIDSPYRTLGDAVAASIAADDNSDFYLKSLPGDESYTLWPSIQNQSSLNAQSVYGGYDANWERDPLGNQTRIVSTGQGFRFLNIDAPTTVSGIALEVMGPDQDRDNHVSYGLAAGGGDSPFVAENNTVTVNGPDGTFVNRRTNVYGIVIENLADASVLDNVIETGDATLAMDRSPRGSTAPDGLPGVDAGEGFNWTGGDGGAQAGVGWNGGRGGNGATTSFSGGDGGQNGAGRSSPVVVNGGGGGSEGFYNTENQTEGPGGDGGDGDAGVRGSSGAGGIGRDIFTVTTGRNAGRGDDGGDGWAGGGGGGGGGGSGASAGRNGGGGGGGGEGGEGGVRGFGGFSGGESVAVAIEDVANALVARNSITVGNGGLGGLGGTGGNGGQGGAGGKGAPGNFGSIASGGDGGDGGDGGQGGYGGGGAGGPSYGIWVGQGTAPVIEENTIVPGRGGDGAPPRLSFEAAAAGGGGWAYGIIDADPNDGITPIVRNNTISAGTGGNNGHADNPAGESGDVRLQ